MYFSDANCDICDPRNNNIVSSFYVNVTIVLVVTPESKYSGFGLNILGFHWVTVKIIVLHDFAMNLFRFKFIALMKTGKRPIINLNFECFGYLMDRFPNDTIEINI